MLKLYSAPRTRSIRVAWLLEEMQLPYELVSSTFIPTLSTFFIQNTPTGKFPTLDDDGAIMFESGAICEYLIEKYADESPVPMAPAVGDPLRGEFLQWMHFADATAFSPLGIVIWLAVYRDDAAQNEHIIADATARAATGLKLLEDHLADRTYLLGETFSAADIMMVFTLMAAKLLGVIQEGSVLDTYLARLQQREAFGRAFEKTGGFGE